MGTDYAEKERTFVAGLAADTGRGLDAWMRAIDQSDLTSRNDIIDWLRQNGFTFSNASWIERIHHNGGRLVYGESGPLPVADLPPPLRAAEVIPVPVRPPEPAAASPAIGEQLSEDVVSALSAAKGLRPLAILALREIQTALPDTTIDADGPLLRLCGPKLFLALLPGAKSLRLYGDFGAAVENRVARAEAQMKIANKAPPPFPQVMILTDARLIDATFLSLVQAAHARVHS